jgi:hypothetical protein
MLCIQAPGSFLVVVFQGIMYKQNFAVWGSYFVVSSFFFYCLFLLRIFNQSISCLSLSQSSSHSFQAGTLQVVLLILCVYYSVKKKLWLRKQKQTKIISPAGSIQDYANSQYPTNFAETSPLLAVSASSLSTIAFFFF